MKRSLQYLPVIAFALLGCTSLLAAENAKDDAIEKERMKFFGEWQVVALEIEGNQIVGIDAFRDPALLPRFGVPIGR